MLPQSGALQAAAADTPSGWHETGCRKIGFIDRSCVATWPRGAARPQGSARNKARKGMQLKHFKDWHGSFCSVPKRQAVDAVQRKAAIKLLAAGRARVHRVMLFVIRLVDRRVQGNALQPLRMTAACFS